MAVAVFNLVFQWEKRLTDTLTHLAFRKEDGSAFDFEPGQFVTFLFGEGKDLKRRSYSIATIPSGSNSVETINEIEIVVSAVPGGFASGILFQLAPGQVLKAMGPVGRLVLRTDEPKCQSGQPSRVILMGTGTGIGPYRAMLPSLNARAAQADGLFSAEIVLGVRTRAEALFKHDFETFAQQHPHLGFQICYSRENPDGLGEHEYAGYVQDSFARLNLNPAQDIVYLCGNPNMIDESFETLKGLGFDVGDIRREKYISS